MAIDRGDNAAGVGTTADTLDADKVVVTPAGGIVATDAQAALEELQSKKTAVADLASTANGKGASLVGIQDSPGNFSSTTVEGALSEIITDLVPRTVATLTELKALPGDNLSGSVYLLGRTSAGDGGQGFFRWDASDLSSQVSADTQSGVYVPPDSDATGASGAWVRQYTGRVDPRWFGITTSAADNSAALKAALDLGIRKFLWPEGTFTFTQPVLDGDTVPDGLDMEGAFSGLPVSVKGTRLLFSGSGNLFGMEEALDTISKGCLSFRRIMFESTSADGGIFRFNDPAVAMTDDNTSPNYIRMVAFDECYFQGPDGTDVSANAIEGAGLFELDISDTCEFRGWLQGVYLEGGDNITLRGRYSSNVRHIKLGANGTFGNSVTIDARFFGPTNDSHATEASAWLDLGTVNGILVNAPWFEGDPDNGLYFNDCERVTVLYPRWGSSSGTGNVFRLGAEARDCMIIRPTSANGNTQTWTADPITYGRISPVTIDRRLTILYPDSRFYQTLINGGIDDPRLNIIGIDETHYSGAFRPNPEGALIGSNGVIRSRSLLVMPSNYQHLNEQIGPSFPNIVEDTDADGGYAFEMAASTTTGAAVQFVVGRDIHEGDTIQARIRYKLGATPGTGSARWNIRKNGANLLNGALTETTSYANDEFSYTLSGFSDGDILGVGFFASALDTTFRVNALHIAVVSAAIADPSGGTTIDAEARTAINSIIDALEAVGIIARS